MTDKITENAFRNTAKQPHEKALRWGRRFRTSSKVPKLLPYSWQRWSRLYAITTSGQGTTENHLALTKKIHEATMVLQLPTPQGLHTLKYKNTHK